MVIIVCSFILLLIALLAHDEGREGRAPEITAVATTSARFDKLENIYRVYFLVVQHYPLVHTDSHVTM